MIKLDDQLLSDLDLRDLPSPHKKLVLQAIYSELEMRIGTKLSSRLTKKQLDEFEVLFKADNQQDALAFLESNVPDYKNVANEEFDKLRTEIPEFRDAIRALSSLYNIVDIADYSKFALKN